MSEKKATNHVVKIQNEYFLNLEKETKKAEIRYNDRDYQVGDFLSFKDSDNGDILSIANYKITHIHSNLGMKEGYIVLSLKKIC